LLREQGRTYFALDEFVSEASPSTCSLEHQPHFLGNDYRIAKPGHHSSGSKLDNLPDIRPLHNNTFLTSSSIINAISIYTYSYSTSASVGHALRLTSEDNFFEVDDAWTRFRIMQTLKSPTGLSSLESSRSVYTTRNTRRQYSSTGEKILPTYFVLTPYIQPRGTPSLPPTRATKVIKHRVTVFA
jgi:hypothetical protein